MQAMGEDMDLRILPGENFPVHPDETLAFVERDDGRGGRHDQCFLVAFGVIRMLLGTLSES
jgi:hypothetical protein